jgi:hypothetical protein
MARRRNPHEFQDGREEQSHGSGVGDLPADIGYERREHMIARGYKPQGGVGVFNVSTPGARTMPPNAVPDIGYQSRERAEVERSGVTGTMSQGATVRSTFDARPINARDWLQGGSFFIDTANGAPHVGANDAIFTVPEGYIAVIRDFQMSIFPVVFGADLEDFRWTLSIARLPVNNYDNMALGQESDGLWFPAYALANENEVVGMRLEANVDYEAAFPQDIRARAEVILHGNLLLRTGVPIEYEPGNPADAFPIVRGTELKAGGGVQPPGTKGGVGRPPSIGRSALREGRGMGRSLRRRSRSRV